jgi:hypothetical protein
VTPSPVRLPTDRAVRRTLARTFLRRFFDNEITGGSQDLAMSFFWLVAFFAGPLTFMSVEAMLHYRVIVLLQGPDALRLLSRPDKTAFIVVGMMAAAMISALVWSSLMLERRDGLILGTLPVRGRSVVVAKLAALAVYVSGIAVAMHAVSSVLYGFALADHATTWRLALLSPFAHFIGAVAACAFVFLCVTSIQGLALVLTGPAGFRRVSTVLQMALVAAVIVGFTNVGRVIQGVAAFNEPGRVVPPAPWLLLTPPVWFLGLEEWILGGAEPVFTRLAATAIVAFAGVAAITVVTYAVAYRRIMVRVVEAPEDSARAGLVSAAADWIARRLSRTPARRASAQFFFTSIGRVERLRFVLAIALGILCAWLVPALVTMASAEQPPSAATTFGLSYAALAFVIVGARIAIAMPSDLRAAWMVPVIDVPGRVLRSGLWRALYGAIVVPLIGVFAALHAWIWNWPMAAQHAVVMAAVGALLVELSLWHFDALPHHRPWRPEHVNLRVWWPAYLFGFIALTRTLPQLEWAAHDSLVSTGAITAIALAAAAILHLFHRRPYPAPSFDTETFVETERVLGLE